MYSNMCVVGFLCVGVSEKLGLVTRLAMWEILFIMQGFFSL